MTDIAWTNDTRRLSDLVRWKRNPKKMRKADDEGLLISLQKFGYAIPICISPTDEIYDGHQRERLMEAMREYGPDASIDVRVSSRPLTEEERREFVVRLKQNQAAFDWDVLGAWGAEELQTMGLDGDALAGMRMDVTALGNMLEAAKPEPSDAEPQIDRAAELLERWGIKPGDLWRVGEHRILCGDSTDVENVGRLVNGEKFILLHADPPYGMGKEKDGIANDNLYREKLDAFQMAWWRACRAFVADNASAYIWGTAVDLWRLWYCGGLRDSERLTFRNEIVWQKPGAQGVGSGAHRQYPTSTERCLFFMLGEQGFNTNQDNYWEGWEPIRAYLAGEWGKVSGKNDWDKHLGNYMGKHYFTKSQWCLPTEAEYRKLQMMGRSSNAFRRDYDELKREFYSTRREFYSTRAYFDNTHGNMTDVWDFGRVTGDERMGHAAPKPVEMMERVVKSSAPVGGLVYIPFLGTAPDMVACQNLNRRCRAIEISPAYVAVALERMATAFPSIEIERVE